MNMNLGNNTQIVYLNDFPVQPKKNKKNDKNLSMEY